MKKTIKIFDSFEEADKHEKEYWQSKSYQEKLSIGFELYFRQHPERRHKDSRIKKVVTTRKLK